MSVRTVHFPLVNGTLTEGPKVEASGEVKVKLPPAEPPRPAIVIYGRMMATCKHASQQIGHLPHADHDYHGTLQMILTASLAIEADARLLLKYLDQGGGF